MMILALIQLGNSLESLNKLNNYKKRHSSVRLNQT